MRRGYFDNRIIICWQWRIYGLLRLKLTTLSPPLQVQALYIFRIEPLQKSLVLLMHFMVCMWGA